MPFHVFRHVEPQHVDTHHLRQPLGDFRLADAGRSGEQIAANGLFRFTQSGAGQFDRGCQCFDGLVLAKDHTLQLGFQVLQH